MKKQTSDEKQKDHEEEQSRKSSPSTERQIASSSIEGDTSPDQANMITERVYPDGLPLSARGQSAEVRKAIRKRQVADYARRKRSRDNFEKKDMEEKMSENQERIEKLEKKLMELKKELEK